jgi:hypothetical protein
MRLGAAYIHAHVSPDAACKGFDCGVGVCNGAGGLCGWQMGGLLVHALVTSGACPCPWLVARTLLYHSQCASYSTSGVCGFHGWLLISRHAVHGCASVVPAA